MKRIGIVGCGIRGRLYAEALTCVRGVEVVGMCDTSAGARDTMLKHFDGPVLGTYDDLYGLGLDAVIIATPDFAHRDAAVAAANAGMTIMVEKPLATTVEDAKAIYDAVRAAHVECLVAFENRWNPYCMRVKQLVADGMLGRVLNITGVLSNSYYVPLRMLSWAASSSPSWFLLPHIVDLALWVSSGAPANVVAKGRRGELASRGVDTWDSMHALLAFDDGGLANLQSSWVLPDSRPSIVDFRFEVVGSEGSACIDGNNQGLYTALGSWASPSVLPVRIDGKDEGMAAWMARSFAERLLSGEPLEPGVDQGLLVTQLIEAMHRSATCDRGQVLPAAPEVEA